jgi:hypothetical protein
VMIPLLIALMGLGIFCEDLMPCSVDKPGNRALINLST